MNASKKKHARDFNLGSPAIPDEIPGFPDFGHVRLARMPNTRDLGGMPAADGRRIRPCRLIRSGDLHGASKADLEELTANHELKRVIDFRTDIERKEAPDPAADMPHVTFYDLPVFEQAALGITHEGGIRGGLNALEHYVGDPRGEIERLYQAALLGDAGKSAYAHFMRILLEAHDGATLWHCTEGKDRAGMGSMLVEYALGVPMEYIRADYIATNVFARNAAERLADLLGRHGVMKGIDLDVDAIMYADMIYLDHALDAVAREYGGLDGYLADALGLGKDDIEQLRAHYLK